MVYSNKFVVCILVNGTPQNELANGVVKLPFGTEYSLRFRNKHSRRAVVKIFVDGENVSGGGYIIPANDHVDIKRHWDKDRAFKFVSLDSPEAVDDGKNGPNPDKSKGLIEAHFYLEKEQPVHHWYYPYKTEEHHHHHHHYPKPDPWRWKFASPPIYGPCDNFGGTAEYSSGPISHLSDSVGEGTRTTCSNSGPDYAAGGFESAGKQRTNRALLKTCSAGPELAAPPPTPELQDGCTVMGESTGQRFSTTYIDLEDSYTTLKIFLQGWEDERPPVCRVPDGEVAVASKKSSKSKVNDLEAENERLRKELAELENANLKKKISRAKKKKKAEEE